MENPQDQVICLRDKSQPVYYAMVNGKLFGAWDRKYIAEIGLLVEQRRAAARKTKQSKVDES